MDILFLGAVATIGATQNGIYWPEHAPIGSKGLTNTQCALKLTTLFATQAMCVFREASQTPGAQAQLQYHATALVVLIHEVASMHATWPRAPHGPRGQLWSLREPMGIFTLQFWMYSTAEPHSIHGQGPYVIEPGTALAVHGTNQSYS